MEGTLGQVGATHGIDGEETPALTIIRRCCAPEGGAREEVCCSSVSLVRCYLSRGAVQESDGLYGRSQILAAITNKEAAQQPLR